MNYFDGEYFPTSETSRVIFGDTCPGTCPNGGRLLNHYMLWLEGSGYEGPDGGYFAWLSVDPAGSRSGQGSALLRDISPVPVPAAIWLFGTGILGLIGFSKRRRAA